MKKKFTLIVFLIVTFLAVANMIFWGTQKKGFYIDEVYTYEFTSELEYGSLTADRNGESFYNQWYGRDFFLDYFEVSDEEAFDYGRAIQRMRESCHPPLFYLLFFTVASFVKNFSMWIGIGINIAVFIPTLFFLYKTARNISKSDITGLAVCAIYGLSAGAVTDVIFIRMYMLLTFFTVLYVYIHSLLWEKSDAFFTDKKRYGFYLLIFITTVLGTITHYFFCIFAFFMCLFMCIVFLCRKRYRTMIEYGLSALFGVAVSFIVWPYMLSDITGPRGSNTVKDIISTDLSGKTKAFTKFFTYTINYTFGGHILIVAGIVAILAIAALILSLRKKIGFAELIGDKKSLLFWCNICFASTFNTIVIAKAAPYVDIRYGLNMIPINILLIISVVGFLCERIADKKIIGYIPVAAFILLLLLGYRNQGVHYLYPEREEINAKIEAYSDAPAVFVMKDLSENKVRMAWECPSFLHTDRVYVTYEDSWQSVYDVIPEDANVVLLFIIQTYDEEERQAIVSSISKNIAFSKNSFYCDTTKSDVYLLER